MNKQMKIIMSIMSVAIMLFITMPLALANDGKNFSVILTANKTAVKHGDTVEVTIGLGDFSNIGEGINSFLGDLEFDKTKLSIESEQIKAQNGWDAPTYENDKLLTAKGSMVKTQEEIIKITFTVNANAEVGTTSIKVKNAEAANSENDFVGEEGTINIEIAKEESEVCEHTYGKDTSNNNGTHSATCSKCSEKRTGNCTYQEGKCSVCGYSQPTTGGEDETCEHTFEYESNGEGYHGGICSKCKTITLEPCTYEDGKCIVCGHVESTSTKCDHSYGEYKDNGDGTHSNTCIECGYKLKENHKFYNSECKYCNAKEPKDNTTADKEIPKAGLNTMLTLGIVAIVIIAVVMFRKNQKYRDIK